MKTKFAIFPFAVFILQAYVGYSQSSTATNLSLIGPQFLGFNGLGPGGPKILEVRNNYALPINVFTNNKFFAQFTVLNALGGGIPGNGPGSTGDGLTILNQSGGGGGGLDLWCDANISGTNGTHIKFDGSGLLQGAQSRFEIIGNLTGLWFNARRTSTGFTGTPRIIFNVDNSLNSNVHNNNEVARFSNTLSGARRGFMRVGLNPTNFEAETRLQVVDITNAPQFRITWNQTTAGVSERYADFQSTSNGDLAIMPFYAALAPPFNMRFVGIHTLTPGNTLEINSQAPNPSGNGSSGLRFTDLQYNVSTPTAPLTGQGVLSVDASGNVVYIQSPGGTFGGLCASGIPQLGGNSGVDMFGSSFYFVGTQNTSKVGIGVNCNGNLIGKLHIIQSAGPSGSTGIFLRNFDGALNSITTGITSIVGPPSPSFMDLGYTAGSFLAHGSKLNIAVEGFADGLASNGAANYGGKFTALNGGLNYGIWAEALPPNSGQGPNYAGYFNGDVVTTSPNYYTSDQNLKTNINVISDAWSILSQLIPKAFYFDTVSYPQIGLSKRKQYGFVAQDIENILPELVSNIVHPERIDSLGNVISPSVNYKSLNYQALIGLMMAGMKELKQQLDSLQNNARLSSTNTSANTQTIELSSDIILYQNMPNPFGDETVINYYLPDNVSSAKMLFYDETGRMIKEETITNRGNGSVTVNAQNLAAGIYAYSLEVNGKNVQTRKMQKMK